MDSFNLILKKIVRIFRKFYFFVHSIFEKLLFSLFKKNGEGRSSDFNTKAASVLSSKNPKEFLSSPNPRVPSFRQLKYVSKYLSSRELWVIRVSLAIILISLVTLGVNFYIKHLQVVPVRGGKYVEGLIGSPKYINPLYSSINDVDNDISSLVYSSLFKRGKDGELVKDLVEDYSVSEDNKIYNFTVRSGAKWHDDTDLVIDDIIFTFNLIKDKQYNSPLRAGFIGVEIERVSDNELKFVLADPYAAFLELLTFGILPADIWAQVTPESAGLTELNLKPIGSGPYKFDTLVKDKAGNIKEYNLVVNDSYYDSSPLIDIGFKFFYSFEEAIEALNSGSVDGLGYVPQEYKKNIITPKALNFYRLHLPQLMAIFLNQENNPALGDKMVRQALFYAIDRNEIISSVLEGDAFIVDGPILPNSFAYDQEIKKYEYNPAKAVELLEAVDWKLEEEVINIEEESGDGVNEENDTEDNNDMDNNEEENVEEPAIEGRETEEEIKRWRKKDDKYLTIKLTTVESGENQQILEAIKGYWEKIGIRVELEVLPASKLQMDVLRPRNFEALFYGQAMGADPDPYAFWHSSQVGEGGLNIASYKDEEVDQLLEDARLSSDISERQEKYKKFQEIISEDVPAVFMYSPIYIYIQGKNVKGFDVNNILYPKDRFANIDEWNIETGKKLVW